MIINFNYKFGYEMGKSAAIMNYPLPDANIIDQYSEGFIQGYRDYHV